MRTIERTTQFKKDYKRELKGAHPATLDAEFQVVLKLLITDAPLPSRYRDHGMTGNLKAFRDCHIKPDLVLIYNASDATKISLERIGSHSELGI